MKIEKEPATPEKPAKYRTLSIASIRDALVQSILYNDVLYELIENLFKTLDQPHVVSFAYRKGRSIRQVVLRIKHLYDSHAVSPLSLQGLQFSRPVSLTWHTIL